MASTLDDLFAAANAVRNSNVPAIVPASTFVACDMAALSSALTTATPVTVPGMARPYLAHQGAAHLAANYAISEYGCALLGDDMGMGKTQVLFGLVAERVLAGGYAIMVAPAVALQGYRSDLAAAFPSLRLAHLHGRTAKLDTLPDADIYFLTDDSLTLRAWFTDEVEVMVKGQTVVTHVPNAFVTGAAIFTRDEIHRDKGQNGKPNSATSRSAILLTVGEALRQAGVPMVGATGTLLTNRAVEAFMPLRILGGNRLAQAVTTGAKAAKDFLWRYCAPTQVFTGKGMATVFGTNFDRMPELHGNLRSTVYVRREKSDLGDMLPHSGWIVKPIALGGGAMARYRRIEREFLAMVLDEKGPEAFWRAKKAEALTKMSAMRMEAGRAKVAASVEYAKDLIDQGRKVVMFYVHNDVLSDLLTQAVKAKLSYGVINGSVTGVARIATINEFQAGKNDIMFAQVTAAGMAVTLTAAADAIFIQCPWSAGELKQCADRILRVDDKTVARAKAGESVTWHVLHAAHENGDPSFDMALWSVLEMKAAICDAVNAGRPVTMSDESVQYQALMEWVPMARKH